MSLSAKGKANNGAKSNLPRTTPFIGIPDGETIALVCSNWGQQRNPCWYYNLKKHPPAELAFIPALGDSYAATYVATEVTDNDEYERLWQKACDVYIGYPKYRLRAANRRILSLSMTPEAA